jgi:uncharacterized protein YceH (UPF0502 family)
MLRGEQTPGELRARTERLYQFGMFEELEGALHGLIERELVARHPRRPGQKEERYVELLGGEPETPTQASAPQRTDGLEARVAELEERVAALERTLEAG